MRTTSLLALLLPLALLTGCGDSDGDGLSNTEEAELGTDPDNADTDGDGLSDGEEALEFSTDPLDDDSDDDGLLDGEERDIGTNPLAEDSDEDGYSDGMEVQAGTDPADAESTIYKGGWPYNVDKDALGGPSLADAPSPTVGAKFARIQVMDQHGDTFDLYDMLGQGVPVVVDISAEWCGPCRSMSQLVAGQGGSFSGYWPNIPGNVNEDKVRWVTVMGEDRGKQTPSQETLHNWDSQYPNENVPVVAGDKAFNQKYIRLGWPTVYLLNDDGTISHMPDGTQQGHWAAPEAANKL